MSTRDLDALSIEAPGNRTFYLGTWKDRRRDGPFAPLWNCITSVRSEAASFFTRRAIVLADVRLSDAAKKEDEKTIAKQVLEMLGTRQRGLNHEIAQHDAMRMKLAEVAPADAPQTILDLALAQFYREAPVDQRNALNAAMVGGEEPRLIVAVLRLPRLLFGMTEEVRRVIHTGAIARANPDQVRELQLLSEAAGAVQHALSRSVQIIVENSALTLEERMVSLGAGAWEVHIRDGSPGALGALATRYGLNAAGGG